MRLHKKLLFPLSIAVLLAIVIAAQGCDGLGLSRDDSTSNGSNVQAPEGLPPEFKKLAEVWAVLKENHVDKEELNAEELSRGAVRGMLEALEDPYASYLTPEQYSIQSQDFSGSFTGIGAEVTMRDGRITIISPLPGTPAEEAGLRPGDVILAINGDSTEGIGLQEAVATIRGPKGEPVELLILHRSGGEPVSLTIVRDEVKIRSVEYRSLVGDIGHLKISSFTPTTEKEVVEAIETYKRRNDSGLVLDLRNNPGGLLEATVDVTDLFVDSGLVLYEIDSTGNRTEWKARSGGVAADIPMVVLMNEFSASGSEVLIGAIKDHNRAPTMGTKTFGKGSVNTLRRLSDGSGVYFTVGRWFTPNGTVIEGEGIEPDMVVENSPDSAEDQQLDRAISVLQDLIQST